MHRRSTQIGIDRRGIPWKVHDKQMSSQRLSLKGDDNPKDKPNHNNFIERLNYNEDSIIHLKTQPKNSYENRIPFLILRRFDFWEDSISKDLLK